MTPSASSARVDHQRQSGPDRSHHRPGDRATSGLRSAGARAAATALVLLALAGCASAGSSDPADVGGQLRAALDDGQSALVLSSLDAADGDEFLVVCPYESTGSVDERLGFAWDDAPDYSRTDDRQTLAFIRAGEVSSHAELSRDEVDFCSGGPWDALPIDSSLPVTRTGDVVRVDEPS